MLAWPNQAASGRGVHGLWTAARRVRVVVTSGKGRRDPSETVVILQRRMCRGEQLRRATHCTCFGCLRACACACQDRVPYAEPVVGGIEEGGGFVVDPIRSKGRVDSGRVVSRPCDVVVVLLFCSGRVGFR